MRKRNLVKITCADDFYEIRASMRKIKIKKSADAAAYKSFFAEMQNANQSGLAFSGAFDSETGVDIRPRTVFASQELEDPFEDALPRLEKPRFPNLQTYYHREYWIGWDLTREPSSGAWCGPPDGKWHAVLGPERTGAHVLKELFECESFPTSLLLEIITYFPLFELRLYNSTVKCIKRTNKLILDDATDEYGRRWRRSYLFYSENHEWLKPWTIFYRYFRAYEHQGNYCMRCGEHDLWKSLVTNGTCRECRHQGRALATANDRAGVYTMYGDACFGSARRLSVWACVVPGQISLELLLLVK